MKDVIKNKMIKRIKEMLGWNSFDSNSFQYEHEQFYNFISELHHFKFINKEEEEELIKLVCKPREYFLKIRAKLLKEIK